MKIVQNNKELLKNISEIDIYNKYYFEATGRSFELNKRCRNPFVSKDNNPSFIIYYKDGDVFHKAFNSDNKGNCWKFIMDLYLISYKEAVDKVLHDFGLLEGNKYLDVIKSLPKIEKKEKVDVDIKFSVLKNWTKNHELYLKNYHLSTEDLQIFPDTIIYPLKRFWINKEPFILKNEIGFVYYVKDIEKVKIYLPLREKGSKFYSSIPFDYIHGINSLESCDKMIISKSIKDAWVIHKCIGICQTVVQAENPQAITQNNIELINSKVKDVYVGFDADDPGVKNCKILTEKTGWKYINSPKKYLPIKDWADLAKEHGFEPIIKHFQDKKVI